MKERHPRDEAATHAQELADLSHDLRTPLNAILGLTELMTMEAYGPMGDVRYTGFARDIHDAGSELKRHIDSLLQHSNLPTGRLDEVTDT